MFLMFTTAPEGFVTAIKYDRSGWIGNLIVAKQCRCAGIGGMLFSNALSALQSAGARTIWLTASEAGIPLYRKLGFNRIDTIVRWVGSGQRRHSAPLAAEGGGSLSDCSRGIDIQAWDDRRTALLEMTTRQGRLFQQDTGFIVRQEYDDGVQFGPFSASNSADAERLFDGAAGGGADSIRVDVPASNRAATRLFSRRNMRIAGSTALMYRGKKPAYRPELIYGLATMGSCG